MANKIIIIENGKESVFNEDKIEGLTVSFLDKSDNNTIKITAPYSFHNVSIIINGNNNSVEIGEDSIIRSVNIYMIAPSDCRTLVIGKRLFFGGGRIDIPSENNQGIIGDDCLFSSNISISTEDGHPIYDMLSKKMINKGGTFKIGNHVWLGYGTTICKNAEISDNVVVDACSVVTKNISEENCAVGGCPAKILKKNIGFSKLLISKYELAKAQKKDEKSNGE